LQQQYAGFADIDVLLPEYAKYAKHDAKYAKYVDPISICRTCTPDFADDVWIQLSHIFLELVLTK
jgi:hypothetical protein